MGECLSSVSESHALWCRQVATQRVWEYPWDPAFDALVTRRMASEVGRAWATRGSGEFDQDILQDEVAKITSEWDVSDATTPDLIPRCAYKLNHQH